MPVWKYRSIEEVPPTPAYAPSSPEHLRQWRALWARSSEVAGKRFRSGVFRFRSFEEGQLAVLDMEAPR